jgi:DNA-binding transcriptional ArsR family regulator
MDKHIKLLDTLSHNIRGKILSTLDKQILKHLEEGKTYSEIAEILGYEDGHIGSVAREIYGLIAQKHKIKVTRSNLFSVLETLVHKEPDDIFSICHKIQKPSLLNRDIKIFNKHQIIMDLSTFWKFNAKTEQLILKNQYPIIVDLSAITVETLGKILMDLSSREQLSGDAFLELTKLIKQYLTEQ